MQHLKSVGFETIRNRIGLPDTRARKPWDNVTRSFVGKSLLRSKDLNAMAHPLLMT